MDDPKGLLDAELGEILYKLAELYELNTTAAAILHRVDDNGSSLILVSNISTKKTSKMQDSLKTIIKSPYLTPNHWTEFFPMFLVYIQSNLRASLSKQLIKEVYDEFTAIVKEAYEKKGPGFVGLYAFGKDILKRSPKILEEIYKKNISQEMSPHNMNFILFTLQKRALKFGHSSLLLS